MPKGFRAEKIELCFRGTTPRENKPSREVLLSSPIKKLK